MEDIHKISEVLNYVPSQFKVYFQQNKEVLYYLANFLSGFCSFSINLYIGPLKTLPLSLVQSYNSYYKGDVKHSEYYKEQFKQIDSHYIKSYCEDSVSIDYFGMLGKISGNYVYSILNLISTMSNKGCIFSSISFETMLITAVTVSTDVSRIENEYQECQRVANDYLEELSSENPSCVSMAGDVVCRSLDSVSYSE